MPAYLESHAKGILESRVQSALSLLNNCTLCPRQCRIDRRRGALGICQTGRQALVASYNLHFGEEAPLVGEKGSGTIFFAGCNLGCVFCQNWEISQRTDATVAATAEQLAGIMIKLQQLGALNINLVTPSHVVPQILEALPLAINMGLNIPLVYNSSGYDSVETLQLLDGIVDIYMPDVKFWDEEPGRRYCNAPDYGERAREAVSEMHRQVGDLVLNDAGEAVQGVLVRHLVMPGYVSGSAAWMDFLAKLSPNTYINVMDQYHPSGLASQYEEINAPLSPQEFNTARQQALESGLTRLDDNEGRLMLQLKRLLQK